MIDLGVASFVTDSSGATVFILEGNGVLRRYQSGPNTLDSTPLATNVQTIAMTAANTLYFLDTAGTLRQNVAGVVSTVDSNVSSFQLDGEAIFMNCSPTRTSTRPTA